jgi:ATP synthase protein I
MAANEPEQAPEGGEDPRLASLDERLKAAHHAEAQRTAPSGLPMGVGGKGAAQGNRVISVLLGYPLGGGLIGWLADGWLGSRPWAMLAMLFLGFAAACREIWRISNERPE